MHVVTYNADVGKRIALFKPCLRCGRDFHPFPGRFETQKYCSRGCSEQPRTAIKELSPEQIAWLAALLDGEGNVMVTTRARYGNRGVRVTITNTCLELQQRVLDWTGIGYLGVQRYENPRHKTRYNWIITGGNAKALLKLLQPWLIVKRDIVREVLDAAPPAHWLRVLPEAFVA